MTTKEILNLESCCPADAFLLFHEGLFWRGYNRSACALCLLVHPFKVSTRFVKKEGKRLSSVGFPEASLVKWLGDRQADRQGENVLRVSLSEGEARRLDDACPDWLARQGAGSASPPDTMDGEVASRIRRFSLERASPLDCMNLVAELKQMLHD